MRDEEIKEGQGPENEHIEKTVSSKKAMKPSVSKDGIIIPPAPQIVDDNGVVWSFSLETDHGGHFILRDGKKVSGTGVKLVWKDGKVYLRNDPGAWFIWDDAEKRWAQTGDSFGA